MRPALRALVAGGLGFAVSLIAACGGGSRLLSSDQANALSIRLDQVQNALNNGNCAGVAAALNKLSVEVDSVSNESARNNLIQGVDKLQQLARQDCPVSSTQSSTATTTTSSAPTTTQTTPTVTTQTQTTTTPTATTPTNPGTTTSAGSGGAGLGPGNSSNAPGQNK
jgi:hypothetical protein